MCFMASNLYVLINRASCNLLQFEDIKHSTDRELQSKYAVLNCQEVVMLCQLVGQQATLIQSTCGHLSSL